jgi:hypothetical protein
VKTEDSHELNLAGPCGFYCGTCSHFLARSKGVLKEKHLKDGCRGCREQDKRCASIKRDCALIRNGLHEFCFQCRDFPCDNLRRLDQRHRRDDNLSVIDNLLRIKEISARLWLAEQEAEWRCLKCGGNRCVIDRTCYDCGENF